MLCWKVWREGGGGGGEGRAVWRGSVCDVATLAVDADEAVPENGFGCDERALSLFGGRERDDRSETWLVERDVDDGPECAEKLLNARQSEGVFGHVFDDESSGRLGSKVWALSRLSEMGARGEGRSRGCRVGVRKGVRVWWIRGIMRGVGRVWRAGT